MEPQVSKTPSSALIRTASLLRTRCAGRGDRRLLPQRAAGQGRFDLFLRCARTARAQPLPLLSTTAHIRLLHSHRMVRRDALSWPSPQRHRLITGWYELAAGLPAAVRLSFRASTERAPHRRRGSSGTPATCRADRSASSTARSRAVYAQARAGSRDRATAHRRRTHRGSP